MFGRHKIKELGLLLAAFAIALAALLYWHLNEREALTVRYLGEQQAVARAKKSALETTLIAIYQNIRTITLLPGVKGISGSNRVGDSEDVVASGRFTAEAQATVQQIYNNLASRVSVSEVYAVLDGLDAAKDEIPFFMFDTLVFGDKAIEEEDKPADFPEESEDAEYAYFPQQIARIKAAHPRFQFATMDDIPAYVSPMMRTCDNTQYLSQASDDVHDTYGMLYSVPFYSEAGAFRGVISAILRANVLEAMLMDVPFVPLTDQDRAAQAEAGWTLPAPARFVLRNADHGIRIADRRNSGLDDEIRGGIEGRNVFRLALEVPSDGRWELTYFLPESMIEDALLQHDRSFLILLLVVLGALVAATVAYLLLSRIRRRLGGGTDEVARIVSAVSDGKLDVEIDDGVAADSVLDHMHSMVLELSGHMRAIDQESKQIAQSSYQISEISGRIVESSAREHTRSAEVSEAMGALSHTAATVHALSGEVRSHADEARDSAREGMQAAHNNIAEMGLVLDEVLASEGKIKQLNEANQHIQAIVRTISEITDQTNLLALNAAIEAARAGEHGRGFAVVADEVRKLAQHAGSATDEISRIIEDLNRLVGDSTDAMQRVSSRTRVSVEKAESSTTAIDRVVRAIEVNAEAASQISAVSVEQQDKVNALQQRLEALTQTLDNNSRKVHTTGAISQDLFRVTERLCSLIQHFRFDQSQVVDPIPNEHRRSPRYEDKLLVVVSDRDGEVEALTADISLSGARIRVPLPLAAKIQDQLELRVMVPASNLSDYGHQQPAHLKAKILWQNNGGDEGVYYGLEFVGLDARQRADLERCFAYFNQAPQFAGARR